MLSRGIFLLLTLAVEFIKSCPTYKTKPIIKYVPICEDKTYCEEISYYPTDIVTNALKMNPQIHDYASLNEQLNAVPQTEEEPEEESLCVSTERVIFPKTGLTKNFEWKYIVNHQSFNQSVRIETCLEENKPCRVIEGFAEGYYTKCKQKYIYRQLVAIASDGSIDRDFFQFPASCCCHIKFQADKFLHSFKAGD